MIREHPVTCDVAHLYARKLHLSHHLHHAVAVAGEMLQAIERYDRCLSLVGKVHLIVVVASHGDGIEIAVALAQPQLVVVATDGPRASLVAYLKGLYSRLDVLPFGDGTVVVYHNALYGPVAINVGTVVDAGAGYLPVAGDGGVDVGTETFSVVIAG